MEDDGNEKMTSIWVLEMLRTIMILPAQSHNSSLSSNIFVFPPQSHEDFLRLLRQVQMDAMEEILWYLTSCCIIANGKAMSTFHACYRNCKAMR